MTPEAVRQLRYEDYERYLRAQKRGEVVGAIGMIAASTLVFLPVESHTPDLEPIAADHPDLPRKLGAISVGSHIMLDPSAAGNPLDHPDRVYLGDRREKDYVLAA